MSDKTPTPSDFGALVDRVGKVEDALVKISDAVAENTALTKDIKDAQTFARISKRIIVALAAIVVTIASLISSGQHIAEWIRNIGKH